MKTKMIEITTHQFASKTEEFTVTKRKFAMKTNQGLRLFAVVCMVSVSYTHLTLPTTPYV